MKFVQISERVPNVLSECEERPIQPLSANLVFDLPSHPQSPGRAAALPGLVEYSGLALPSESCPGANATIHSHLGAGRNGGSLGSAPVRHWDDAAIWLSAGPRQSLRIHPSPAKRRCFWSVHPKHPPLERQYTFDSCFPSLPAGIFHRGFSPTATI